MESISSDTDHLIVPSTLRFKPSDHSCHTLDGENPVPLSSRCNKNLYSKLKDSLSTIPTSFSPLNRWKVSANHWIEHGKTRGTCLKPTLSFERRRYFLVWSRLGGVESKRCCFGDISNSLPWCEILKIPKFQRPEVPKTLAKDISFIFHVWSLKSSQVGVEEGILTPRNRVERLYDAWKSFGYG